MKVHSKHKLSIVAAAVLSVIITPSNAALISVDSFLDNGIDCTLRNAITSVNQGPGVGFVTGCISDNADALGTNDSIIFDSSLNNLTIFLGGSELLVQEPVVIDASDLDGLSIDAIGLSRVMQANLSTGGTQVELKNLTLSGGSINGSGGGILSTGTGSLDLSFCTVLGNTATFGGGVYSESTGSLTVSDSTISGNLGAGGGGAGISANSNTSSVHLVRSVVSNNTASFDGGGITSNAVNLYVTDSTISSNSSGRSGAGISLSRSLLMSGSTLHSNSTAGFGGAIGSLGNASNPRIINSTISGNISDDGAGGFQTQSATSFNIQNSTLKDNVSSSVSFTSPTDIGLNNSILSDLDGIVDCANYNSISAMANSIIQGAACGTTARADLTGLLALADNGGLTLTHALAANSNAIGSGDNALCPEVDQRGEDRDAKCDVGAFEFTDDTSFIVIPLQGNKAVIIPSGD